MYVKSTFLMGYLYLFNNVLSFLCSFLSLYCIHCLLPLFTWTIVKCDIKYQSINQSVKNKVVYKIFGAMSKDLYIETSAHFGIECVENLVANRLNRFINRYCETDDYYLCQMLRWLFRLSGCIFYCVCLLSVCWIYSFICVRLYHRRWWNKVV